VNAYKDKLLPKEDLTNTLRAFQTSTDVVKTLERDVAWLIEESRRKGETPPASHIECALKIWNAGR